MTLRDHLAAAARTVPAALADLQGPPMPPYCDGAWDAFWELAAARAMTDAGPQPIAWQDIDAWQRVTRRRLTPLEVLCVRAADEALLAEVRARAESARAEPPRVDVAAGRTAGGA
jgi:hypothetical protein